MGSVALLAAPAAVAQEFEEVSLTAEQTDCGEVTITFTNLNDFKLSANYGYGEPDWERPWSDTVINDGHQ